MKKVSIPDDTRVQHNTISNINFSLLFLSGMLILLFAGTSQATDVSKQWYPENSTMRIYNSLNGNTWATVQLESVSPDIDRLTKDYNVTAYVNYFLSDIDSFKSAFKLEKGKYGITDSKWYILKPVSYTVNDYGINSTLKSRNITDNQTGENTTVWYWDNQSILIGNHTEYQNKYVQFNPYNGISVVKGKSYHLRQILFTKAELGNKSIQTNVTFFGLTEDNMTWWNTSWNKKAPILINNTGNDTGLTYYQVNLNVTYDSDMQNDGSDLRVVNDTSGLTEPYWKDDNNSVNGSHFNIWFNATNTPASVWTNSTYYLYYGNSAAASASSGTNTFDFFDDFSGDLSKWTYEGGITIESGSLKIPSTIGTIYSNKNDFLNGIFEGRVNRSALGNGIYFGFRADSYWNTIGYMISDDSGSVFNLRRNGATVQTGAFSWASNTWYNFKMIVNGTADGSGIVQAGISTSAVSTWIINYADSSMLSANRITLYGYTEGDHFFDDIRVRKYASPEPSASLGVEESVVVTFNQSVYNTGWQTIFINSTQNMTSIRSMMNSSNVNWLIKWNSTSQKWESYKAGWSVGATRTINGGDAVYIKFQNNDTIINRNNGTGNYNWTLSTGWNLAGNDYNGSRTLAQINTSINSLNTCDANLISYTNLSTQVESTFTCNSAGNASISVNQGEGFFMNSTIVINRTRSW